MNVSSFVFWLLSSTAIIGHNVVMSGSCVFFCGPGRAAVTKCFYFIIGVVCTYILYFTIGASLLEVVVVTYLDGLSCTVVLVWAHRVFVITMWLIVTNGDDVYWVFLLLAGFVCYFPITVRTTPSFDVLRLLVRYKESGFITAVVFKCI